MAYADGELDSAARTEVEAAMHDDPQVAQRVAQHRELRARLQQEFAVELTEVVPERLLAAVRPPTPAAGSKIVDLEEARSAMAPRSWRTRSYKLSWLPVSMAASILVGVGAGFLVWRHSDSIIIQNAGDRLVASGSLARGLSNQLAGDRAPASAVEIGFSFVAKSGDYCRTFTIADAAGSGGVACRRGERWEIRVLTQPGSVGARGSEYRTASSTLSPAIVTAVEELISGEPLDRTGEIAARKRAWQAAGR